MALCPRYRVYAALINTEHERVAVGLTGNIMRVLFPLSSCEAAKYEVSCCLDDSQCPALSVTAFMEVL